MRSRFLHDSRILNSPNQQLSSKQREGTVWIAAQVLIAVLKEFCGAVAYNKSRPWALCKQVFTQDKLEWLPVFHSK